MARTIRDVDELLSALEKALDGRTGRARGDGGKGAKAAMAKFRALGSAAHRASAGMARGPASALLDALLRLDRVTRGVPEVMVKVSYQHAGAKAVKDHLAYISRHGKLELEGEQGQAYMGRGEVRGITDEWGIQAAAEMPAADRKDTLNVIFSMPRGTDPNRVKGAVRAVADQMFAGHRYVFVLHDESVDEDSRNPHCHVVIQKDSIRKSERSAGRLRHGPLELAEWRREFAVQLRARGIEAEASRRYMRGRFAKGERQAVWEMRKTRGVTPMVDKELDVVPGAVTSQAKGRDEAWGKFQGVQKMLDEVADAIDLHVPGAKGLATRVRAMSAHARGQPVPRAASQAQARPAR